MPERYQNIFFAGLSTQDDKAGPSTQDNKKKKAVWNDRLTEELIDICIGEVKASNRPGTHFNKLGWTNIIKKFNEKTRNQYNYKQIKNKLDNLKANRSIWMSLVGEETGFRWDPVTNTIDAPDAWWEKKLQKISDAAKFQERGLQHAMKLDMLFRNTSAIREGAWAPALLIQGDVEGVGKFGADERLDGENTDIFKGLCNLDEDPNLIVHEIDDLSTNIDNVNPTPASYLIQEKGKKRVSLRNQDKKRKKVVDAVQLSQEFGHLVDVVESSTMPSKMTDKPRCSIDEVMKMVRAMPEMIAQPKLLVLAAKVLLKREHREMFVALQDTHLQIEWLKEISKQQN